MPESGFDLGLDDDDLKPQAQPQRRELSQEEREFIKKGPAKVKEERKVRMTVDVPEDVHAHMKMLANRNRRPMSREIYAAVEAWLGKARNQID